MRQLGHVVRLSEARHAEEIQEKRNRKAEDMAKRTMYRKAHGLPVEQGFWSSSESSKVEAEEGGPGAAAVAMVKAEGEGAGAPRKKVAGYLLTFSNGCTLWRIVNLRYP